MTTTTEYYDQAIVELRGYRQNEPDGDKRAAATARIDELILAKQAAAFDAIANRSPALRQAVAALQGIVDNAGAGPGIADSLSSVNALIADLQSAILNE
jgi:hypothetical protein